MKISLLLGEKDKDHILHVPPSLTLKDAIHPTLTHLHETAVLAQAN